MKKKRLPKRVIYVRFLDHSMGPITDKNAVMCEAVGFLLEEDEATLTIMPWVCNEQADNHNNEVIVIIKGCIKQRSTLKF